MVQLPQDSRQQSGRRGTDRVYWQTLSRWRRLEHRRFSELVSSQHKHHTAATGLWHCPSLPVAYETVRIAVALRLSSELGSPHTCRCGSLVDATGTRGLVCK